MIYYVSTNGNDSALGTKEAPFKTIDHAAQVAVAGDTVRVFGGTYREWVAPRNSGEENARIVYEAVEGEHPIIKGSEIVTDWERVEGTVWKKVLSNSMFGEWNPYAQKIEGDWFVLPTEYDVHHGDVYINGVSCYEASSMEDLYEAEIRYSGYPRTSLSRKKAIRNPENTVYRWYTQVNDSETTILCNFQELDPNKETIEINVRKACFYPKQTGRNYITLRGFEIAHAACPFTPPTADQIGMVGANWSKGWIIENNDLHDAKCSAVSIGKEASTGDNEALKHHRKHSHFYQTEAVFAGLQKGWSKENIGSHIIRNNVIHDCGQNGVVGHMGCVFSRIEHNHIYNIGTKYEFVGAELGGIKLHTAIDVVIEDNNIHDCWCGIWLDWQAQGTRVTKNLLFCNDVIDIKLEVTHGPCTIDNNVFLSENSFENMAQGTAYLHNVTLSNVVLDKVLNRETPYHYPHSTQVKGITKVYGGDDRILNNIILGNSINTRPSFNTLSTVYNPYYTPERYYEETKNGVNFNKLNQPVWIDGNAYAGYAAAFRAEENTVRVDGMTVCLEEKAGDYILNLNVPASLLSLSCKEVTTESLGEPIFSEEPYENPDGTPIDFTVDMLGNKRDENIIAGPFARLSAGENRFVVWKK